MSVEYVLEAAFGVGAFELAPDSPRGGPEWTDLSELLEGPDGPRLFSSRGRSDEGGSPLTPGSLTARLYASGGGLDGLDLRPGVTVRLWVGDELAFSGWAARWPRSRVGDVRWVDLEAHDLAGVLAQMDGPSCAVEADLAAAGPSQWWRPGPTGWSDRVTGRFGRVTGPYEEVEKPLADGDVTWGPAGQGAYGVLPGPLVNLGYWGRRVVAFLLRRMAMGVIPLVVQSHPSGAELRIEYLSILNAAVLRVKARGDRWTTEFSTDIERISASSVGDTVSIAVEIDHPAGLVRLYQDGRLVGTGEIEVAPDRAWAGGTTSIGGDLGASTFETSQVIIDHVVSWDDWSGDAAVCARMLSESARLAWAGDDMGGRARRILNAAGVPDAWLDIEESGIRTRQGYRYGAPVDLLEKVAETEQGWMGIGRDGRFVFRSRTTRVPMDLSMYIGDDTAPGLDIGFPEPLPPVPIVPDTVESVDGDLAGIINVAQVTAEHGLMQTVEDRASITRYGRRAPLHLSGLLHATDRESRRIAHWLAVARSEPIPEVSRFTLDTRDRLPDIYDFIHGYRPDVYPETLTALITPGRPLVVSADDIAPQLVQVIGVDHDISDHTHYVTATVTNRHHNLDDPLRMNNPWDWFRIDDTPLDTGQLTF